jgi:hypothetical protein
LKKRSLLSVVGINNLNKDLKLKTKLLTFAVPQKLGDL